MSVSTIESKLRSLQSELERLNKSLEQEEKKELSYVSSIGRTEKSITKNTSLSALKTKQKSISGYKDKVNASKKKQSEIKVKISNKLFTGIIIVNFIYVEFFLYDFSLINLLLNILSLLYIPYFYRYYDIKNKK